MRVGFIGLGNMGGAAARNLQRAGHDLVVHDRGDMILFVGGDDAAVDRALPVLAAMGEVRRLGGYGNGDVAKLVNNQLWFVHAAAIGEAMVAAKVAGLDPELSWEAMRGGAADSFVLRHDTRRTSRIPATVEPSC